MCLLVSKALGQARSCPLPRPGQVAPGPVLGESPSQGLGSRPSIQQMKSVRVGVSVSSPGPPEEALQPLPSPHTQGGSRACSWRLWLQLCWRPLQECVTGPSVPGRYPGWGVRIANWLLCFASNYTKFP